MIGTWINMGTVLAGGVAGWLLGERLPARVRETATVGVGLSTLVLGAKLALSTHNLLVLMLAVIGGGALGAALGISGRLESLSRGVERAFAGRPLAEGFLTASLLFCIGPMSILGALEDGLFGDWSLLGAKSILDGVSAVALAASLGPGVLLSLATLLVYQGGITLGARLLATGLASFSPNSPYVAELSAAGGAIILALGIGILKLRDLKPADFLPALTLAPFLTWLFVLWGHY